MTAQRLLRYKIMCWAVGAAVGAADLALVWWLGGVEQIVQHGMGAYGAAVLLLGAMFFSLGAGMLGWAIVNIGRAHASSRWPSVRGRVLASDVDVRTTKTNTFYDPKVRYEYTVLGTRYENDTIEFDQRSFDARGDAEHVTARYPAGAEADVHYDPGDPPQSCLQCGDDSAFNAANVALWMFALPFVLPLIRYVLAQVLPR